VHDAGRWAGGFDSRRALLCARPLLSCIGPVNHHEKAYEPLTTTSMGRRHPSNIATALNANAVPEPSSSANPHGAIDFVKSVVSNHFMPIALCSALVLGMLQPTWGAAAAKTQLQSYVTVAIFVISGLQLRRGEAFQALKSLGSLAYGLASILLLSPLLLGPVLLSLPLQPPALALGLAVFVSMPTSLSSGITLTSALGGNVAMSILLTVSSNMLAVFTLPLVLPHVMGSGASCMPLDPAVLRKQLVLLVLLPTIVGATIRACVPGVAKAVDSNRKLVSYVSTMCLAVVPWMQVSKALLFSGSDLQPLRVVAAATCGLLLHVVLLIANICMVQLLRLGGSDPATSMGIKQAVVLQTSQKTLPVALAVLNKLSDVVGDAAGIAAITAVFSHLAQVIVDSILVSKLVGKRQSNKAHGEKT